MHYEGMFTESADYNLPVTCAVNIGGALQDRAGREASQAAGSPVKFHGTSLAGASVPM